MACISVTYSDALAERVGFEPTVGFPLHTLSKRAPSTTRTSLRAFRIYHLREPGSRQNTNCARNCAGTLKGARSLTGTRFSRERFRIRAPNCAPTGRAGGAIL